jgi:hypothetical protein
MALSTGDQREQYLKQLPAGQYFIRNRDDTYCQAEAVRQTAGDGHAYISLAGYHDQLWDNPAPYVHLLQSVL